jgi:hypothetical protein
MTARPFLASVRHEEAEGGLATMRRGRAHDDEERATALGAGGGERGEGEELWWGVDEVRDALGVLGEALIGAGVEGSGRGRRRNGWSREDEVGHRIKKRRVGGTVDSASLGTEESVGGIGWVATPTEGGGDCSCSGKKKVKAYFTSLRFRKWET